MMKILWMMGGLCAAAVGFLVLGSRRRLPRIDQMADRLEPVWIDRT